MSIERGSQGFLLGDWRVEPSLGRISRDDRRESPWDDRRKSLGDDGRESPREADGSVIRIDPRNMKVLQLLASRPGELVTQTQIETTVWAGLVVTPNSVYQSVAQLRRALGDDRAHPRYIETISRKGYRLIAPVTWPTAPAPAVEEPPATPPAPEVSEPELSAVSRPRSSWPFRVAASVAAVASALTAAYVIYDSPSSPGVAAAEQPAPLRSLGAAPLNASAVRADMHFKLASHAWRSGDFETARQHLEQASVAQRAVSGYRHPSMGVILAQLADVRRWGGDYAAAELLAREAQKIFASTTPEPTVDTVRATMALADALIDDEKHDEAALEVERALNESRLLSGDRHELSIDVQHSLAMLRLAQGRLDEAEQIARGALDGYLKLQRTNEVTTKYPFALALILFEQGRYAEAAAEARREIDQLSAMTTRHVAHVAVAQHVLGRSLNKLGRCEEAERLFRDELRGWNEIQAPRWRIARASSGLGEALLGQGRLAEAEQQLRFAATELAAARGWLPRQAMQATQERLEQLREARKMQQIRHAQARAAERGS